MDMAGSTDKLTTVAVKAAGLGKHFDGGGLFLHVLPNGARYWRLKYRYAGKEKLLALVVFPEVNIAEARRRRDTARAELRDDSDPGRARQKRRSAAETAATNTFEVVAPAQSRPATALLLPISPQPTPDNVCCAANPLVRRVTIC